MKHLRIGLYRIAIFCLISYRIYRFLLWLYCAITKNDTKNLDWVLPQLSHLATTALRHQNKLQLAYSHLLSPRTAKFTALQGACLKSASVYQCRTISLGSPRQFTQMTTSTWTNDQQMANTDHYLPCTTRCTMSLTYQLHVGLTWGIATWTIRRKSQHLQQNNNNEQCHIWVLQTDKVSNLYYMIAILLVTQLFCYSGIETKSAEGPLLTCSICNILHILFLTFNKHTFSKILYKNTSFKNKQS